MASFLELRKKKVNGLFILCRLVIRMDIVEYVEKSANLLYLIIRKTLFVNVMMPGKIINNYYIFRLEAIVIILGQEHGLLKKE